MRRSRLPGEDKYPEAGLPEPSRSGSLEAFIQRHGNVTEEYKFYGGEITLRFNVDEHRYYRVAELGNLIPVNGVTNTVGIIDKSHMLTPWAAKMAIQKLLRIMPTEMVDGIIRIKALTFAEFTVIALEAKGAHKEKLDEASDIGHIAHKCLEDSINFAMQNDPQKIVRELINVPTDEQAANAARSGFAWMSAHNVRWIETESKIYSREHDYAGTMDGLCVCDSCTDRACCPTEFKDRLSLADWKSSNHLKIEYLFQTASYKHAKMEEYPDLKIIDTWILRLGKSEEEAGKFVPWHMTPDEYEEDFKGYLACLTLTRLVDSVEERMKSQKGTIRAVKKEQRETAKAIAKEKEKMQKALDKAAAKIAREEEKQRVKAEAKAERERLKAEKKLGRLMPVTTAIAKMLNVETGEDLPEGATPRTDDTIFLGGITCTRISKEPATPVEKSTSLDSTCPMETSTKSPSLAPEITNTPSLKLLNESTISMEATEYPSLTKEVQNILKSAIVQRPSNAVVYEESIAPTTIKLPMEG